MNKVAQLLEEAIEDLNEEGYFLDDEPDIDVLVAKLEPHGITAEQIAEFLYGEKCDPNCKHHKLIGE